MISSKKLIILSAPSGSGKNAIIKHLLSGDLPLEFSISATSRKPRDGEIDGKDYHFLSLSDFQDKISKNDFLEWEKVYQNDFYGTLKSEIERIWNNQKHAISDLDVFGGLKIKHKFPKQTLSIFIKVLSIKELEKRLLKRGSETEKEIKIRLEKAKKEIQFAEKFDAILLNDQLDIAKEKAYHMIFNFLKT